MRKIYLFFVLIFLIGLLIYLYYLFRPVTMVTYQGRPFYFRDDVKEAKRIPVYPDEKTVYEMFWDPNFTNVTILFKPLPKGNQYYSVESFELTYKLSIIYAMNGYKKQFTAEEINSYDNIRTHDNILKIALIAPAYTNQTHVEGKDNVIYIHAKDYRDMDLATIKTILVAMNIN